MRILLSIFGALAVALVLCIPVRPQDNAFKGEIMDSQCAGMGSHDQMMKSEGAKNAKECSDACVKMGGKYVLYSADSKTTYQLDDQDKAKQFSGQKVEVSGTYDKSAGTIHVSDIKSQQ